MSVFQGDFLGFQLGTDHSYNLNITRVSTNDRYQDQLLPSFTDMIVQVPGGDGTYYWDTNYTQKQITVDFAFDSLRDEDIRKLRQMLSVKTLKPLIFDEYPYKKYMVKCAQPPTLRYICFSDRELRIYKGEGTIVFVAYYPFAFAAISPKIVYKSIGTAINNEGDMPANLSVTYSLTNLSSLTLDLRNLDGVVINSISLSGISAVSGDSYLLINTQTQLIEGLDANYNKTGNLYNKYIESGDFFYPPVGRNFLFSSQPFVDANYTPLYY